MLTKSCPVAALDVVQVVTVLCQELGVAGVECQSVATGLEFRGSAVAFPVLVARVTVRVEPVVIGALEVLLSQHCNTKQHVCKVRASTSVLDVDEVTAVWGGWSSCAVVTAARHVLQMQRVAANKLRLIS